MVEADVAQSNLDPDQKAVLDTVIEELIDEVSLGLCFEIHRSCKVGSLFLSGFDDTAASDTEYAIVDRPGVDVLGQVPSKKNYECVCPNCQRHLAASRFAPHLEKCMGMGRNSSRIASRRIANNQKHGSEESGQEDENDNDWNYAPESKRVRRMKKEKSTNSPRNRRLAKLRNGGSSHDAAAVAGETSESLETAPNYERMTLEERKALLLTSCGVISEHTKRMCTRTGKCVQHSDEQRRQVRQLLLRQSRAHDLEDIHIDIDTFDDAESQSFRESLQWEMSSNSSPADSTSTNNSLPGVPLLPPSTTASSHSSNPVGLAVPASHKRSSNKPASSLSKNKKHKASAGKHNVSSSGSSAGSGSSNKDQQGQNLYDFS
ncbi:saga-associated factor 11 homolog [Plakobranchus ocellatus]|uniref:SAGA-associated factor 11 homolog n=1 Tax=Plakobranchus ocellatus TaxID=259542 RepID=A0AAV3Y937_9GAST|nr:saga-associated factor 11 homolog [Plakobranchus ocellatus]